MMKSTRNAINKIRGVRIRKSFTHWLS